MKFKSLTSSRSLTALCISAAAGLSTLLTSFVAQAHPFASGLNITNSGPTSYVSFVMNEAGADVKVVFEDGTTNAMGTLPKGGTNFVLTPHTSYRIICFKAGNGVPFRITTDSDVGSQWANPRGVDTFKNPKNGALFGRIIAGSSGPGGIAATSPNVKYQGLYAYNADQTDATGQSTNSRQGALFAPAGLGGNGPWRIRTKDDDYTVVVSDQSILNAGLWLVGPDLTTNIQLLNLTGDSVSKNAGIHGRIWSGYLQGSIAQGNLILYTADDSFGAPSAAVKGPFTAPGSFNCIFRYDIGSGPLPWNSGPDYAYTMGLDGIATLTTEMTIAPDGKIFAAFGRANASNPDLQILDSTGSTLLWTSWDELPGQTAANPPYDPWAGINAGGAVGTYGGMRISPDGVYLASQDLNNGITVATMTNGFPDDSSIFGIVNTPATQNARGICWDAADNIWAASSGQGLLRCYSLGLTTTCVTSNDFTGTNGSFVIIKPATSATVLATTPTASQNYTNNAVNPGAPIPGVFTISLTTSTLAAPLTVTFQLSGTASNNTQYVLNTGTNVDGVVVSNSFVIFPAGAFPHPGNWSVAVKVIPTATPVSGPTTTAGIRLLGGTDYAAATPLSASINILNTGPQVLMITPSAGNGSMSRGVPGDQVKFTINRTGDLNGPGNDSVSSSPKTYTITNFNYKGTASYPLDYKALAQVQVPTPPYGNLSDLQDGINSVSIPAGAAAVTVSLGKPVKHTDVTQTPTNLTIIVTETNAAAVNASQMTNCVSTEGYSYFTSLTNFSTLNELDNTIGKGEVVLWSNPLTNATDSVNWSLTFANTAFSTNAVLPTYIPFYSNNCVDLGSSFFYSNDFIAAFGKNINDDGVPPSDTMLNNGWNTALKLSVNKNTGSEAGVNLYPHNVNLLGNYALRFDMYLSIYQYATNANNSVANSVAREYAAFGINHYGTNCNWRLDANPRILGTGNFPTNSDGVWCAIDAGYGGITPADFDLFTSPAIPNSHGTAQTGRQFADNVSNTAQSQAGVFKHPPFNAIGPTQAGEPVNQWVNVSMEVTSQTNVQVFIVGQRVLANYALTNQFYGTTAGQLCRDAAYISGTPMLGYLDPNANIGDPASCFVMFSNVRAVETMPYVDLFPVITNSMTRGVIVTQGFSCTITSSATYAAVPGMTNLWFKSQTPAALGQPPPVPNGLTTLLSSNASPSITNVAQSLNISVNGAIDATNYVAVYRDSAGAVTSLAFQVELVLNPAAKTVVAGLTTNITQTYAGPVPPTAWQWYFNTVSNFATATKLVTNAVYNGSLTNNLFITNMPAGNAGYYWCAITNRDGGVVPQALVVTIATAPSSIVVTPTIQTNIWGTNAFFSVSAAGTSPFTYQWYKDAIKLTNNTHIGGSTAATLIVSNITAGDVGNYTATVTNIADGGLSSAGVLVELTPAPQLTSVTLGGGNVVMAFTSSNPFDKTTSFTLQSAGVVQGPYTNSPATFTGSAGSFQVTTPVNPANPAMFYRLLHVN